jgi:putative flippase GtrA
MTNVRVSHIARLQLVRYAAVGAGNTATSFATYMILTEAGLHAAPAAGLAFLVGAMQGYVLNRTWTFDAGDSTRSRLSYVVVQGSGLALVTTLVWVATERIAMAKIPAELLATPPVTVLTFVCNRWWTFGVRRPGKQRPAPLRALSRSTRIAPKAPVDDVSGRRGSPKAPRPARVNVAVRDPSDEGPLAREAR